MLRFLLIVSLLASFACMSSAPEMRMADGIQPIDERWSVAPEVGEVFPDITVVDDRGQRVNIRSLAGEKPYTVLTLGCLT